MASAAIALAAVLLGGSLLNANYTHSTLRQILGLTDVQNNGPSYDKVISANRTPFNDPARFLGTPFAPRYPNPFPTASLRSIGRGVHNYGFVYDDSGAGRANTEVSSEALRQGLFTNSDVQKWRIGRTMGKHYEMKERTRLLDPQRQSYTHLPLPEIARV